jgi:para-aminobenzoate synthetase component 1
MDSARYHLLGTHPWLSVKSFGSKAELFAGSNSSAFDADPFDLLRIVLSYFSLAEAAPGLPVAAGLFGYLSYDLKSRIEALPQTTVDDLHLPQMCLYAPSCILVHDREKKRTFRLHPEWAAPAPEFESLRQKACRAILDAQPSDHVSGFHTSGILRAHMEKGYYKEAVSSIKQHIRDGDIYQANFAQRFETDFRGSAFSLFKKLYQSAPAPFYAYIHAGDHRIVSTSPERFLKQSGAFVETRPIKGTRPRGATAEEDRRMREDLLRSAKDEAELSMIVDLLRNDFGRVCKGGSVRVTEHKRLEAYENVFHMVSIVTGRLRPEKDAVDLLRAAFPGGSITGCPRIRAMEVIDDKEPVNRHIYTGAIGYISFHRSMDLSVAIRTATIVGDMLLFSVGGGIVHDSDVEAEYEETLHKGRSLAKALVSEDMEGRGEGGEYAWHNGLILPLAKVRLPFSDPGVHYGYGFFETIRVHEGRPAFLSEHLERFGQSWKDLFAIPVPEIEWSKVFDRLIEKNRLSKKTAALKLMATRGVREHPPYDHQIIVSARPYQPRPALARKGGLMLALYPEPRQSPLAAYKSLNYLYYHLAGKWAVSQGGDEALIQNPDGSVSETHSANLLLIGKGIVTIPASPHVLSGIMQNKVLSVLRAIGYEVRTCKVMPRELSSSEAVILTNSLIGAAPVRGLDGNHWREDRLEKVRRLCGEICLEVL